MEPTRPAAANRVRDTIEELAGRLISRPLGGPHAESNLMLNHRPSRTEPKPFMSGARAAVLAAALAASSCAPLPAVTPHPAPSETSTVAPAETITVSPGPSSVTTEPTTIYAGPGNVHYPIIAEVPQGTYVYPTGSFGDFVRVEHESRVGYVLEAALDRLPRLLPELLPGD